MMRDGKEVVSYGKADPTARRALVMMEGVMPPFRRVDDASSRQLASTMFMRQTEKTRNEEIMEWMFIKSKVWEHDEEYRNITYNAGAFKSSNDLLGNFFVPHSTVTAIYMGIRILDSAWEQMKRYCAEYDIPYGRVRHDFRRYTLLAPDFDTPLTEPDF